MADMTLAPPPFREALVVRDPLTPTETWQRWLRAFWEQMQTTAGNAPGPGPWQPLDATLSAFAGLAGTPNTLAYFTGSDALALTPLSPYSRTLLDDADAGTWRSTLGLGSGSTITASGTATHAALWSSATTLTSTDSIQVGAGWKLGLNSYPPPVNVGLRGYRTALDSLYLGAGDVLARWPLDCPGQGHVLQLGVYYGPEASVDLRCRMACFDHIAINEPPVVGWYLTTYNLLVRANIQSNELYVVSNTTLGLTGIGGAVNASYHLTNHGQSYLYGYVGCGTVPVAGWAITTNSLLSWGGMQANGTLSIGGTSQLQEHVGIHGAPDARFYCRMYGDIYCDGIPYNGGGGPWVAYSDRRLKRNIQEIPHALATMTALHGVLYEYADTDMGKPAGVRMGVLAQEVEAVLPEWVGELDGMKTTQLSKFEALTIESFKAVVARLEALEHTGWLFQP